VVVAPATRAGPIVLFTNDEDTDACARRDRRGVTAYVVAGLAAERVKPVLDVAMARFQHEESLAPRAGRRRAPSSPSARRSTAPRALLMSRHSLTRSRPTARLRKTAMDQGLRLADVAAAHPRLSPTCWAEPRQALCAASSELPRANRILVRRSTSPRKCGCTRLACVNRGRRSTAIF
jgi:hypothetical protein